MNRWLLALVLCSLASAAFAVDIAPIQIKYGRVTADEIWSGDIYLIGDLTVPESISVTVAADTTIHFASYDLMQSGDDPKRCEILVQGRWYADSQPGHPVRLLALDGGWVPMPRDPRTQVLSFQPYQVETDSLREEFRGFKNQYIVLWSVIYALWIMR